MVNRPPSRFLDGAAYQARFDALAATGMDMHGEADLVEALSPRTVLDAGTGTGRVAIELARRGIDVVGVDRDASMLGEARRLAPDLTWVEADLVDLDLARQFEMVVMAGNVLLFTPVEAREGVVRSCAAHVALGGALISGFQLTQGYELGDYDRACEQAGLELAERWSTWERAAFGPGAEYAVSLHRRRG
jgi:SAM-dependent methyltransferase